MIDIRETLDDSIDSVQDSINFFRNNPNEYTKQYLKLLDRIETDLKFIKSHFELSELVETIEHDRKTKDIKELS